MSWRYLKDEIKAVLIVASLPALFTAAVGITLYWLSPALYLAIVGGVFAISALIGILAGLKDDWKVSLKIERRQK